MVLLRFPLSVVLLSAFLTACDQESSRQQSAQRESVPQRSPAEDLKSQMADAAGRDTTGHVWSGLHYDVTKSNSLVTPYEGTIEVTLCPDPTKPKEVVMYRAKLGHRDGRWVVANLQASTGWGLQAVEPNDDLGYFKAFARHYGF